LYQQLRERMQAAGGSDSEMSSSDKDLLRAGFERLAMAPADDPLAVSARRRLILLRWQPGDQTGAQVADALLEFGETLTGRERALTWAMGLTVELRSGNFSRFQSRFSLVEAGEVPQFGWFLSEFSRSLLHGYVEAGATSDESAQGKPVPEEYRRSVEVAAFLESELFDVIQTYLEAMASSADRATPDRALERSQMALALKQLTNSLREVLGRRLYLDISEQTTSVLLPRSLKLWEQAVALIESDEDPLESPRDHRAQIALFQESILPRLKELQESQHLMREFGPVIAAQEQAIQKLDRDELAKLSAERKQGKTLPKPQSSPLRQWLLAFNVAVVALVALVIVVRWKTRAKS